MAQLKEDPRQDNVHQLQESWYGAKLGSPEKNSFLSFINLRRKIEDWYLVQVETGEGGWKTVQNNSDIPPEMVDTTPCGC